MGPIFLALVIAAAGSFFIYSWMQRQAAPKVVANVVPDMANIVQVTVAAVDMIPGTKISAEMVKKEGFLINSLEPGHFTDPAALVGRVSISPIKANELILEHRLASIDIKTGGVSALVTEGKRAVAVGGDKVIGLSGFIYPENRVDVLVTWKDPGKDEEITKVILDNVRVLASGTLMQKNDEGEAAPVDVYTLEVTPEEAEILSLIRNQGRIQFALRSPVDVGTIATKGATYDVAMTHLSPKSTGPQKPPVLDKPAPLVPKPQPAKPMVTVEVIQEGQITKHQF
jgi:pilus assembly protein CpaB